MFSGKYILFVVFVSYLAYSAIRSWQSKSFDKHELKGSRIVVTGASYGIGMQMAKTFAKHGAKLFITARSKLKLEKVVEECNELGSPETHFVEADMVNLDSAELVINQALETLGGIDMLVLNHISFTTSSYYNHDIKDLQSYLMVNTFSYIHMVSLAIENLKSNNGRIIVMSSTIGLHGAPQMIPYATSKFALNGFFKSLEMEINLNKTNGLSISLVYPSLIATERLVEMFQEKRLARMDSCVDEIVRGAMMREREIYFPVLNSWIPTIVGLFPGFARDQAMKYIAWSPIDYFNF